MLKFLKDLNLDDDLGRVLMTQLRNLWTHDSTALEGNTLTLGEIAFVIEERLTISGDRPPHPVGFSEFPVIQVNPADRLRRRLIEALDSISTQRPDFRFHRGKFKQ